MLTLKIQTKNAAFEDLDLYRECARLLQVAALKIGEYCTDIPLRDANGHLVGRCLLKVDRGRRRA